MARPLISFTEVRLREAIAASASYSEALRRLGMRPAGGNHKTLQKYVALWEIPTVHFDRDAWRHGLRRGRPLDTILVEGSTYASRGTLEERLYAEGLKERRCELCGQGEEWRGRRMSLILDHRNGVADDNRLENPRIVCPNCNATLDTHCGKQLRKRRPPLRCPRCDVEFVPKDGRQRYCSRACGQRWDRRGKAVPGLRRAQRPPYEELCEMVAELGYEAVGRRYGVTGNAIRKWRRVYEAARPADDGE